jgi:succinate-semialdehyde dehydrogenase/glutarate-semialdehyde dehydrogenase
MSIQSVNPATGQPMRTYPQHGDAEVEQKLEAARAAFQVWSRMPIAERASVVARAGQIFADDAKALARLMTEEMGKTLASAEQEAHKCAAGCRYYAERAASFLAPEREGGDAVHFHPLGVVLAVMPWNFPFWQVTRFAAPALVAGNVGLLKHASNVPGCALAVEDIWRRAGAPESAFQTLMVGSQRVAGLIADDRVAAVTVTGSDSTGREVAAQAGRYLKKTVLELGGSDPFIVLASADLDKAAQAAVRARVVNNGQSCIAAKRFIVVDAVYDGFAPKFVAAMKALRVGDPMSPDTDVGPLATAGALKNLTEQVERSVAAGARALLGGHALPGPGFFFAPTILAEIPANAPAYREEIFGPVASLFRVRDVGEAIALANASRFGLGASVWTRDLKEAERTVRELEAGMVFVNAMVVSDPRFPFGGVKHSGYGRELAIYGLREFVNVKTVRATGLAKR